MSLADKWTTLEEARKATFGGFHRLRPKFFFIFLSFFALCPQYWCTIFPQIWGISLTLNRGRHIWKPPFFAFLPIEGVSSIENTKGTTHRTNSQRCPISNCGSSANIGRVSDLWRTKCAGLGLTQRGCVSCRQGSVNLEPFFEAWYLICNRRKGRSENEWCYEGVHAEALSEYY